MAVIAIQADFELQPDIVQCSYCPWETTKDRPSVTCPYTDQQYLHLLLVYMTLSCSQCQVLIQHYGVLRGT